MIAFVLTCFLPAFLISLLFTSLMQRWAPALGLVDEPDARKMHVEPTPLGGGVGIWLGVITPLAGVQLMAWILSTSDVLPSWFPADLAQHLDGVRYKSGPMWTIVGAGSILASVGFIDDQRNLHWAPRLGIQFLVAIFLVWSGVRVTIFLPYPWLGYFISVMWIIVLVNSFNFLDNMDGLSGGIALVAACLFAVIMLTSSPEPRWLVGGTLVILAGALSGFLYHNWPPARIFMGDSGSYFIGLMMATMTMQGTYYQHDVGKHVILAPLCILAIPLYDFTSVMVIRLAEGRSPFQPDKSHFSHRLVEVGMKPRDAVLTIHLATLTTGLGALLLYKVPNWPSAMIVFSLITCVLAIVAILETVGRK